MKCVKKCIPVLAFTICGISNAQDAAQSSSELVENQVMRPVKTIDLSLSYAKDSIKMLTGTPLEDDVEGAGLQFSGGRIFDLGSNLTTTTSLGINYTSLDVKKSNTLKGFDSGSTTELGLNQKLHYHFLMDGFSISPFLEAGINRGRFDLEFDNSFISIETQINYTKYSGALGLQAIFDNGFAPFVKYGLYQSKFDNTMKLKGSVNGRAVSVVGLNILESAKASANSLIIGASYQF